VKRREGEKVVALEKTGRKKVGVCMYEVNLGLRLLFLLFFFFFSFSFFKQVWWVTRGSSGLT
jgi:hypothetical protein